MAHEALAPESLQGEANTTKTPNFHSSAGEFITMFLLEYNIFVLLWSNRAKERKTTAMLD